jgi:hypothetical protein
MKTKQRIFSILVVTLMLIALTSCEVYRVLKTGIAATPNSGPDSGATQFLPDSPYHELMETLMTYQDSGWMDYSSPLISDSIFVTNPYHNNPRPALFTGAAYDYYYLDELTLYYALLDINGDGLLELLIGPGDDEYSIFSIYSLQEGKPTAILQRHGLREVMYLCPDGTIYSADGFAPKDKGAYGKKTRYSVDNDGKLKTEYFFKLSPQEDYELTYQHDYTDMNGTVYTKSQADEIEGLYDQSAQIIDWRPLAEFFE